MKGLFLFLFIAIIGTQALAKDRICCDEEVPIGSRLTSANGRYFLIFQEDRNLVLYKKSNGKDHPIWASATNGRVNRCVMQRDGNLVLYNYGRAVWASGSNGHTNATLIVQDDGNTVIYDGQKAVWHTNTAQPAEQVTVVTPAPVPAPPAGDRMCCDTELPIGARLTSGNGRYFLIFQEDRNLVLYKKSGGKDNPIWASSTNGRVNRCVMQADGNLVLYKERYPVWASGSNGHTNATLIVQDDGNMVIYDGQKAVWHTNTAQPAEQVTVVTPAPVPPPPVSDRICCDAELVIGSRMTSANGRYFLIFQEDRNLVLYKKSDGKDNPIWASSTNGRVNRCVMQADGNLVLYKERYPVWASGSNGHTNATVIVQDDGNMVIYDGQKAVWQTNTAQPAEQVTVVTPAPVPPPPPASDRICCDSELPVGSRLTSGNGRYFLIFQEDRNLVLYKKSHGKDNPIWASSTNGRVNRCVMQADGNFVLYKDNYFVWGSGSNGHTNATLIVQDDGNVVIYDGQDAVWHTNTAQPEHQRREEQPVVQEAPAPVVAPVVNTPCALPDDQYQRAVAAIDEQAFRDNKMMTAKQAIRNKCLSLAQVRGLAKLFSFEDQTLEFVEYAYDFTSEKSEYYTLADVFSFDTNVTAFNKFLNTK
jgi:hypothetical protein